ncbi:MAG: aconitase X catalytic domain-containing protein [Candidatus Bathyarchaeia archaeon]
MYLTGEEERMLEGEFGSGVEKAMEILVALGDLYDAERLIPVSSAHMAGNFGVLGVEGVEWLEEFAESGVKAKVFATVNPQCFDFEFWREMVVPEIFRKMQLRIDEALRKLGFKLFYTCQHFLVGNLARKGEHLAWAESVSEVFANSVFGAMTNREGDHSAIAAAVVGKTPEYGMHLPENRVGNVLVDVSQLKLENYTSTDYAAMAYHTGRVVGDEIPVFANLPKSISLQNLLSIAYALPVSGAVPMFHAVGITPEAQTLKEAFGGDKPDEKITITPSEVENVYEELRMTDEEKVDYVIFGCPHCTLQEIEEIAILLEGKKVHPKVKLWVFTSKATKSYADRMGYSHMIGKAGGLVLADTCPSGGMYTYLKEQGAHVVVTNSVKQVYYSHGLFNMGSILASTENCINAAVKGRWQT